MLLEDFLASTDILGGIFSYLFIGLLLIYNSVLVSGIQHSDSVIYILFHYRLLQHCKGFPGGLDGKESACTAGDLGLIPGLGRLPRESHGQRSLAGYSP